MIAGAQTPRPAANAVDHLLLGARDLDQGIEWVEQQTGVKAAFGGVHPGVGTRNALLSLGSNRYLEIIAPDPDQSSYNFQIDVRRLTAPRLITWAALAEDIEATAAMARKVGYEVFGPRAGSRATPSGVVLRWKSLGMITKTVSGGIEPAPFFIQWDADATHPSRTAPAGCRLETLEFQHPDPTALAATLKALGIDAGVRPGREARITATFQTQKGRIELS